MERVAGTAMFFFCFLVVKCFCFQLSVLCHIDFVPKMLQMAN